jgi:hypothetical protein
MQNSPLRTGGSLRRSLGRGNIYGLSAFHLLNSNLHWL